LTFDFYTNNGNTVKKQVKAQQGAVFTYENGVVFAGTDYFKYSVNSNEMTFYQIQILSNSNQEVSRSPTYPLKLGVTYEDYLGDKSIRVFRLGELSQNNDFNSYQFKVTNIDESKSTINVWLEKCVNYPICNISYENILSEKTAIEFKKDGNVYYQNLKKNKFNDINSYNNFVLTIYCQSNSNKDEGCYYNFGVYESNNEDGSSSSSEGDGAKSHILIVIIIIIVIIILSILAYIIYLRFFKKNPIQKQIESIEKIDVQQLREEENQN
jgi:hypothetical protein